MVLRFAGRKPDTAIAHDGGCHPVPGRGRQLARPGDLPVIMGVNVNKARRYQSAIRVDLARALGGHLAHFGNKAVLHRNIAREDVATGPVRNAAAADHKIKRSHLIPP